VSQRDTFPSPVCKGLYICMEMAASLGGVFYITLYLARDTIRFSHIVRLRDGEFSTKYG